jgi:hypothetical protein
VLFHVLLDEPKQLQLSLREHAVLSGGGNGPSPKDLKCSSLVPIGGQPDDGEIDSTEGGLAHQYAHEVQ